MRDKKIFRFKHFAIHHHQATMKVGTDGVLLGAWVNVTEARRILDVGTGTGLIALMLAQRTPTQVQIDGIEISESDVQQARQNIRLSPWPEKVQVHHGSLQKFQAEPYDLIVSNPPYFNKSYPPPELLRTQARHSITLSAQDLLEHSKRLIRETGTLGVILPENEGRHLLSLAEQTGWYCTRECIFQSRKEKPVERLLLEFQRFPSSTKKESLVLYSTGENWSNAYRALTRDFYLKS